ncbi:hypothetical protein HMPREF0535_1875 [Limosilactobacillus reuteri MM2-3]|nr:hypothetical protein HMPREF0535_1875 [Limosilactobacillus reuteri MM2-3]
MLSIKHTYARPTKELQRRIKQALALEYLSKCNRGVSVTRIFEEIQQKNV